MKVPIDPKMVSALLLDWYGSHGRDLPWRKTRDPYRIWLSEIMLQQTTVAAVIPYYERFLARFPTLQALASASLDEVLEHWAGLGYYSRARHLHQTAGKVTAEYGGHFPETPEELVALPGIGRSTAGAILSIAFGRPAPILDGNVRRVLIRLFSWTDDPRSPKAEKQLWTWADTLTCETHPHDYAQAIMDLGATVCTPRHPNCPECPLSALCQAYAEGLATKLPIKRKKAPLPTRYQIVLLVRSGSRLLIRQRPPKGLLGGLWELPGADIAEGDDPVLSAQVFFKDLSDQGLLTEIGTIQHAYSHFKSIHFLYQAELPPGARVRAAGYRWQNPLKMAKTPLHTAHRKALELFLQRT